MLRFLLSVCYRCASRRARSRTARLIQSSSVTMSSAPFAVTRGGAVQKHPQRTYLVGELAYTHFLHSTRRAPIHLPGLVWHIAGNTPA